MTAADGELEFAAHAAMSIADRASSEARLAGALKAKVPTRQGSLSYSNAARENTYSRTASCHGRGATPVRPARRLVDMTV